MPIDNEEWRAIPGHVGYEVSDLGQVRSLDRVITDRNGVRFRKVGRRLKQHRKESGHHVVGLGKYLSGRSVHQLVMLAFVGPCPPGMEVCHNNGIPDDNRLENLRYGTRSENTFDKVRHGTHPMAGKTHCKHGHEYTPENTGRAKDGRYCRQCCITRTRARNARLDPAAEKARLHASYLKRKAIRHAAKAS